MKNKNKQTKFPVVRPQFLASENTLLKHSPIIDPFADKKARIKKIMQKDEEVGKVAQATPIVICTSITLVSQL